MKIYKIYPYFLFSTFVSIIYSRVNQIDIFMSIAYFLLPINLISYFVYTQSHSKKSIILYFVSLIILLFLGNRGTILISILFVIVLIFLSNKKAFMKFLKLSSFLVIFLLLFFYIGSEFLNLRIIQVIVNQGFFTDNIRLKLWNSLFFELIKSPLKINGIFADRFFYIEKYSGTNYFGFTFSEDMIRSLYAHNFILEFLYNYGLVIGFLILVLYFIYLYYIFIYYPTRRTILVLFIFMGVLQLMFSSSYLYSQTFWIFIALTFRKGRYFL
jgi:hypothetical protein